MLKHFIRPVLLPFLITFCITFSMLALASFAENPITVSNYFMNGNSLILEGWTNLDMLKVLLTDGSCEKWSDVSIEGGSFSKEIILENMKDRCDIYLMVNQGNYTFSKGPHIIATKSTGKAILAINSEMTKKTSTSTSVTLAVKKGTDPKLYNEYYKKIVSIAYSQSNKKQTVEIKKLTNATVSTAPVTLTNLKTYSAPVSTITPAPEEPVSLLVQEIMNRQNKVTTNYPGYSSQTATASNSSGSTLSEITQIKASTYANTKELAQAITKNATTDMEKTRNIYEWVAKNIQYDRAKYRKMLQGDFSDEFGAQIAFRTGKGVCYDYASLVVDLSKNIGVSAKLIKGVYILSDGTKEYHAWNEIFIKEIGQTIKTDVTFASVYNKNYFDTGDFDKNHIKTEEE